MNTSHDKNACPDTAHAGQEVIVGGTHDSLPQRRNRRKERANQPKPRLNLYEKDYVTKLLKRDLEACKGQGGDGACLGCEKFRYHIKQGQPNQGARKKANTDQLRKIVKASEDITGLDCLRRMPGDLRRRLERMIEEHQTTQISEVVW